MSLLYIFNKLVKFRPRIVFGFSVVELAVSIVAISCIIAALTPVITKKLKMHNVAIGAGGGKISSNCTIQFNENCKLCSAQMCIVCTLPTDTAENQYLDYINCKYESCSGEKYGTSCQKCDENTCTLCNTDSYIEEKICKPCPTGRICNGVDVCPLHCEECSDGESCTRCQSGYSLKNGVCSIFTCNDSNFMQIGNKCVTRKNMGDDAALTIPDTVTISTAGDSSTKCTPSSTTFCCWKGTTVVNQLCDAENGGYSGCKRTVCSWRAANEICSSFSFGNYSWRLPTKDELASWMTSSYSVGKGSDGLMFCNSSLGYNSARCDSTPVCYGASSNYCYPYGVWTGEAYSSTMWYYYYLSSDSPARDYFGEKYDYSVRCVADNFVNPCAANCDACEEAGKCSVCKEGYYLNSSQTCSKCMDNCKTCTNGTSCDECVDGYDFTNGECTHWCSGDNFMRIGNYCWTRKNMGDSDVLAIPTSAGISIKPFSDSSSDACTGSKCCWQGSDYGGTCDAANGSYSGCDRTVCNWNAANSICDKFEYQGKNRWSLPAYSYSLSGILMPEANDYSIGKGDDGMMYCDSRSGYSSAQCGSSDTCIGAESNSCYPSEIWSSTTNGGAGRYVYILYKGTWEGSGSDNFSYRDNAHSVRCVLDLE